VFAKGGGMLAAEKSTVCLSCHGGDRQLAFWDAGKHKKNDVSCADCHTIHSKKSDPSTAPYLTTQRKLQYDVCGSCHKSIRAQLNKNSHHPILEGKVACADCHNPHGALSHAMVKNESITQLCTSCHADKRGPFVWAHMPVEENCLTCHNSHGSNVPKLLTVKAPQLCQDCHGSAHGQIAYGSSFGIGGVNQDRATRFDARACVNCHQMIHGSNAPASRGHFFLR
jgi:DmsE family decaheme c-type cytochrome